MRWGLKKSRAKVFEGDRRIRLQFLWVPLTLQGETRWLEFVSVLQEYIDGKWVGISFVGD